jgi:hypothetical protein
VGSGALGECGSERFGSGSVVRGSVVVRKLAGSVGEQVGAWFRRLGAEGGESELRGCSRSEHGSGSRLGGTVRQRCN